MPFTTFKRRSTPSLNLDNFNPARVKSTERDKLSDYDMKRHSYSIEELTEQSQKARQLKVGMSASEVFGIMGDFNSAQTRLAWTPEGKVRSISDICPVSQIQWILTTNRNESYRKGRFVLRQKHIPEFVKKCASNRMRLITWLNEHSGIYNWHLYNPFALMKELNHRELLKDKKLIRATDREVEDGFHIFICEHSQLGEKKYADEDGVMAYYDKGDLRYILVPYAWIEV